jgi:hypothetical protein
MMATFTQTSNLGGEASVEFTYDDATMKMTGVKLVNNSKRHLDIFIISPLIFNNRIDPGKSFEKILTTIEKPSYTIRQINKDGWITQNIDGIEWRCCLGV